MTLPRFCWVLCLLGFGSCTESPALREVSRATAEPILLTGVTVVNTHTGDLAPNQSILIKDSRIESITTGPTDPGSPIRTIDATGQFAVPGFMDMHVHVLGEPDLPQSVALMLANGVTGFRQMRGSPEILALKRRDQLPIGNNEPAPVLVPGDLLTPINTRNAEVTRATIQAQFDAGADFIKIGLVSAEMLDVALATAKELGLPAAGHLPAATAPLPAVQAGMLSIEHLGPGLNVLTSCARNETQLRARAPTPPGFLTSPLLSLPYADRLLDLILAQILVNPVMLTSAEEFARMHDIAEDFDEATCRQFAQQLAATHSWQVPTLSRIKKQYYANTPEFTDTPDNRYVRPQQLAITTDMVNKFSEAMTQENLAAMHATYAKDLEVVRVLNDAGVNLLAGSDSGPGNAGFGLHDEFDELSHAGLSALRILQMATLDAATFLNRTDDFGEVAPGRIADLVLLDADPTTDAQHLHRIHAVVRGGFFYSRADLDSLLLGVVSSYGDED